MNPTSISFRSGLDPYEYVNLAGGFRRTAEKKGSFVIYPNGETRPLTNSRWQRSRVDILPGSTIVVPRSSRPFDLLALTQFITPVFADLASSAAALAVISDD